MKIIPDDNARGKLFYAFLELVKEKPYRKIKVSELIEKAQVNRTTFYRYYGDIYEFFNRISLSGVTYLTDGMELYTVQGDKKASLDKIYALLTERIDAFGETIMLLTSPNGNLGFLMSFRGYLIERLEGVMNPQDNDERNLVQLYSERLYIYLLTSVFPQPDLNEYRNIDFRYTPKKSAVDNVVDMLSTGKSELSRAIMTNAARIFLTKEPRNLNVNAITSAANVSRTEFYNFFGSTKKLIHTGLWAANFVCSQELTELCTCEEEDFADKLTSPDYGYLVNNDSIIELVRHHREYYQHLVNCFYLTRHMLIEKKGLDEKSLTQDDNRKLDFFVSWAVINFIAYSDDVSAAEYRKKIYWAKKVLYTENS